MPVTTGRSLGIARLEPLEEARRRGSRGRARRRSHDRATPRARRPSTRRWSPGACATVARCSIHGIVRDAGARARRDRARRCSCRPRRSPRRRATSSAIAATPPSTIDRAHREARARQRCSGAAPQAHAERRRDDHASTPATQLKRLGPRAALALGRVGGVAAELVGRSAAGLVRDAARRALRSTAAIERVDGLAAAVRRQRLFLRRVMTRPFDGCGRRRPGAPWLRAASRASRTDGVDVAGAERDHDVAGRTRRSSTSATIALLSGT